MSNQNYKKEQSNYRRSIEANQEKYQQLGTEQRSKHHLYKILSFPLMYQISKWPWILGYRAYKFIWKSNWHPAIKFVAVIAIIYPFVALLLIPLYIAGYTYLTLLGIFSVLLSFRMTNEEVFNFFENHHMEDSVFISTFLTWGILVGLGLLRKLFLEFLNHGYGPTC